MTAVTIETELWLLDAGDGRLVLTLPSVMRRSSGEGVPALVTPRPLRVFKPGEVITLAVPPPCGCTAVIRYDSGAEVLQHSCGRGW